jgi:hypothetical protein
MRSLAGVVIVLAVSLMLASVPIRSAYAYLDAGTGSMILQVLLGGAAGLALAGRLYWQKLLSLFGIKRQPVDIQESHRDQG